MNQADVFRVFGRFPLPPGMVFSRGRDFWIVSDDLLSALCIFEGQRIDVSLEQLHLTKDDDSLKNIGLLENLKSAFVFVLKGKLPILFVISLDTGKCDSIQLNCLYFHTNILDVFSPYSGVFCVISEQGLSLHTMKLDCLDSCPAKISRYCIGGDMVAYGSRGKFYIHHFMDSGPSYLLLDSTTDAFGFPRILMTRGNVVYMIRDDGGYPVVVKLSFTPEERVHACHPSVCSLKNLFTGPVTWETLRLSLFDETSMIVGLDDKSVFIDINSTTPILVGHLPAPSLLVIDKNLACGIDKCYEIQSDYEAIKLENVSGKSEHVLALIGSLFRREDGLNAGMNMLVQVLRDVKTEDIEQIILNIGVYACSPIAQMRFTRALQFCGVTNPHLILRGLVRYVQCVSNKLVDDARIPLLELLCHEECRHSLHNLVISSGTKLNSFSLRCMVPKLGPEFRLDPAIVEDPIEYAEICIENGREKEAKSLILRCAMDYPGEERRVRVLAQKYIKKFQDPPSKCMSKLIKTLAARGARPKPRPKSKSQPQL